MPQSSTSQTRSPAQRVPAAEALLIDMLGELGETRLLSTTLGRGQFARAFAARPGSSAVCHVFDDYQRECVESFERFDADSPAGELHTPPDAAGRLAVHCSPDFVEEKFPLVSILVDPLGEAELVREFLQTAHQRLEIGGRMLAAIAKPDEQWLHEQLKHLFPKVTRRPLKTGVVYLATKTEDLKKVKDHACEFAFRDQGQLIKVLSRPGVFSHRSLDAGARALMNTMNIRPADAVLDLGCGAGAVTLAAAFRAPQGRVVGLDAHTRAVQCTQRGAALNGLGNVTTILNANGEAGEAGQFDLVVGNPPYYSDHRIARIFLYGAHRSLKIGGTVHFVTKQPEWFETEMENLFQRVRTIEHKKYFVVTGTRGRG